MSVMAADDAKAAASSGSNGHTAETSGQNTGMPSNGTTASQGSGAMAIAQPALSKYQENGAASVVPSSSASSSNPKLAAGGAQFKPANEAASASAGPAPAIAAAATRLNGDQPYAGTEHRPGALESERSAAALQSTSSSGSTHNSAHSGSNRVQQSAPGLATAAVAPSTVPSIASSDSASSASTRDARAPLHTTVVSSPSSQASTSGGTIQGGAGVGAATHTRQAANGTETGGNSSGATSVGGNTTQGVAPNGSGNSINSNGSAIPRGDTGTSLPDADAAKSSDNIGSRRRSREDSGSDQPVNEGKSPAKVPRVKIKLNHAAAAAAGPSGQKTGASSSKDNQGTHGPKDNSSKASTETVASVDDAQSSSAQVGDAAAANSVASADRTIPKEHVGQVVSPAISASAQPSSASGAQTHSAPGKDSQKQEHTVNELSSISQTPSAAPTTPKTSNHQQRIVVVKREGAESHSSEDPDHTIPTTKLEASSATPLKPTQSASQSPGDADSDESMRRKRRRGNTNGSTSGRPSAMPSAASPSHDMAEDVDPQAMDAAALQSANGPIASSSSLPPPSLEKPLVTSRDFVPLPPEASSSQQSEASSSSSGMKRKGISAVIGGLEGPDPSQHPTRKPPTQHGLVKPLPLYTPLQDVRNGARANGKSAPSSSMGEGPRIPTHHNTPRHPPPRARPRLFELEEAPVFYPTPEEFADPLKYIQWCGEPHGGNGKAYGIVKIVPPEGWAPDFVLEQEDFRFRTRLQQLNSLSADARASQNYEEQLQKFHAQTSTKRVSIPTVGGKLVDLYQLKLLVSSYGGSDAVALNRKWSEVTRRLGYDEKDAGHLSAQIKRAYTKIIAPFEDFRKANREQPKKRSDSAPGLATDASAGVAQLEPEEPKTEQSSPSHSTSAMDEDVQNETNDNDDMDEALDEPQAEETGPGKRRSTRRRTETKGAPVTLTPQPTCRRRKRKRAASPGLEGSQITNSSEGSFAKGAEEQMCEICLRGDNGKQMLLCDDCDRGYHMYCLNPPMTSIPNSEWYCPPCLVSTGNDFGFDDGETHSLWSFWQRAEAFRTSWWTEHAQEAAWKSDDGRENGVTRMLSNGNMSISEDDVEREFWRLVHSPNEPVEVEYGADVHSTTSGTALPTREKHPLNPYSSDGWNLNNLPTLEASLLRHIKSDVSGMTVPWLYVGMIFSTFCWHAEDHFTYSINYQHFGDTKTWYGVPGEDADKLEDALRKAAPDLFEHTPDLLFHLTTMISPEKLRKEGVRVFACDQRANEFVITFPKAYHSGFNHGFNFNEAVNFALPDWVPLDLECVHRYQRYHRFPVFSHDQLLVAVYQQSQSVETATWLEAPMREMVDRELEKRDGLRSKSEALQEDLVEHDFEDESQYQCKDCNLFCYLGHVVSKETGDIACLDHSTDVCGPSPEDWTLRLRFSDEQLNHMLAKTAERAAIPDTWKARLQKLIISSPNPPLRSLRALLTEGEKISGSLAEVVQLREFVEKANHWVEEATVFITRRHQKRASVATRDGHGTQASTNGAAVGDDSNAELGEEDAVYTLLHEAELLPFDAPEIPLLRSMVATMEKFKEDTHDLLRRADQGKEPSLKECLELKSTGDTLNVRLPETEELQLYVSRREWSSDMVMVRESFTTLDEVKRYIDEGHEFGVPDSHDLMKMLYDRLEAGEQWKADAEAALGPSLKQLPRWSTDTSDYGPRRTGKRSLDACRFTSSDVERLLKATYETPIDADLHKPLETLLAKVKDLSKQCTVVISARETKASVTAYLDSVERVLQQCARVNVVVDGEAELSSLMTKQDTWMGIYDDLINKLTELTPEPAPQHPSSSEELAAWFIRCCDHVSTCLNPVDEAPSPQSAQHHCICRTKDPISDEARVICSQCKCDYHTECLRVSSKGKSWVCPFCDIKKLPRFIQPWRRAAISLKEFGEAAISNDEQHFPWGTPETKRALDASLARAVHFQDALYSCLAQSIHPRSNAGHALIIHLLKKCCGLPFNLDTSLRVPAVPFLAEVLLAHAGFNVDGKPARAIPWPHVQPSDPRYAPDVLPAGAHPVGESVGAHDHVVSPPSAGVAVPVPPYPDAGPNPEGHAPAPNVPIPNDLRQASIGEDSKTSMDIDHKPLQDWHGGSVSHDDDASRDAAFDKDDKKRKRGKRARFVFQEEVAILIPVQGRRVFCLCRRQQTAEMIACDRCALWFHAECVHVNKDALGQNGIDRWNCPMCCVKCERRYPFGELKVKEMGIVDPNLWLDVRCTLRSTTGPVSKLQHWTIDQSQRIVLHLESYYPATTAEIEQRGEGSNDGEGSKGVRAVSQGSSSASNPANYAHGSVAIDPTWTDTKARVTPMHRTPWALEMERLRKIDQEKRHQTGMQNLYSRGVTKAMIAKWYIGWNGKELVYPRRDRQGNFSEVPLGTHLELAPDDQDGSRVVLAALDREAADLRARGLPVPVFEGPPTGPPTRAGVPPETLHVHANPVQPLPWPPTPTQAPNAPTGQSMHDDAPSQTRHGSGPVSDHAQPILPSQNHIHQPREHMADARSPASSRPPQGETDQQFQTRSTYAIPQIPPYRGSRRNESVEPSPSSGDGARMHGHLQQRREPGPAPLSNGSPTGMRSHDEHRPSPSSAGPMMNSSFASQMRNVPLGPSPQSQYVQPYAHAPHHMYGAHPTPPSQYGAPPHHHRDFAHYPMQDDFRRPRASSNASPASTYVSPGSRQRVEPSPSGRPSMMQQSPSHRPRSPPPASARYPLGLGAPEQSPYADMRPRSPASHLSHLPPPPPLPPMYGRPHHGREYGHEQMHPGSHRMHLPPPPSTTASGSTSRLDSPSGRHQYAAPAPPAPFAYDEMDPRNSMPHHGRSPSTAPAQPGREGEMRQLARRMRPNATEQEIDDMVRHVLM